MTFPQHKEGRNNNASSKNNPNEWRFESLRRVASFSQRKHNAKDGNGGEDDTDPVETLERVFAFGARDHAARSCKGGANS